MHTGSCSCGTVRFEVAGELPPPDACHCTQCRKQSGHYWVSTDVVRANLTVTGGDNLTWFQSSDKVRRGFCSTCGAALFWDHANHDKIGVAMGAFDAPTGVNIHIHIFTANKGDYYEISDAAPQHLRWPGAPAT